MSKARAKGRHGWVSVVCTLILDELGYLIELGDGCASAGARRAVQLLHAAGRKAARRAVHAEVLPWMVTDDAR